jgi:hypothetical protein
MKTENPYGKFLDSVFGDVIDFAFFAAVGIMAYRHPSLVGWNSRSEDGTLLWLAIGGMTGFFYILLSHVEQLFDYQIRKPKLSNQGNTASHMTMASESVSGFRPDVTESTFKTFLRLMDRNFRVRETHYSFLIFAILLGSIHIFLVLFLAYYALHTVLTSIAFFRRAKQLRNGKENHLE